VSVRWEWDLDEIEDAPALILAGRAESYEEDE